MLAPPVTPSALDLLRVFQALADENRLRIVDALRSGESCVCDLQAGLGIGQSLLSHHLRVLRESGLVLDRRDGRWVYYSLAERPLRAVEATLRGLRDDAARAEPRCRACGPA